MCKIQWLDAYAQLPWWLSHYFPLYIYQRNTYYTYYETFCSTKKEHILYILWNMIAVKKKLPRAGGRDPEELTEIAVAAERRASAAERWRRRAVAAGGGGDGRWRRVVVATGGGETCREEEWHAVSDGRRRRKDRRRWRRNLRRGERDGGGGTAAAGSLPASFCFCADFP
jgi:hypothetical protein